MRHTHREALPNDPCSWRTPLAVERSGAFRKRAVPSGGSGDATSARERTDAQQSRPPRKTSSFGEPMFDCTNAMIVHLFCHVKALCQDVCLAARFRWRRISVRHDEFLLALFSSGGTAM